MFHLPGRKRFKRRKKFFQIRVVFNKGFPQWLVRTILTQTLNYFSGKKRNTNSAPHKVKNMKKKENRVIHIN